MRSLIATLLLLTAPVANGTLASAVAAWASAHPGAPFVGYVGDSIMAGWNLFTTQGEGGPSGNPTSNVAAVVYTLSGNLVTGSNWGYSGAQMSFIYLTANNNALPQSPKYLVVEGGINNLQGGSNWAAQQTYFDQIKTACTAAGATMIVEEVYPSGLTSAANIAAWNASLTSWATTNSIALIKMHDWMADPANLNNLKNSFDLTGTDLTHLNATGVSRHAAAVYARLQQLEGDAATWPAVDSSQSAVAVAYGMAANGDTVTIPAGTSGWATRMDINKAITLQGAGIGSTMIQDNNPTFAQGLLNINLVGGAGAVGDRFITTRITGIEFEAGTRTSNNFTGTILCTGSNVDNQRLRVDHCKFDGLWNAVIWTFSTCGVFDHNTVLQNSSGISAWMGYVKGNGWDGQSNGDGSWAAADGLGTDQFFFFEDNTMDGSPYTLGFAGMQDAQAGGRYVYRHNTIINGDIQSHGHEAQRERSGRAFEIYNNTFTGNGTRSTPTYFRGGVGVIHDNTFTGFTASANFPCVNNRMQEHDPQPFGGADGRNPWDVNHASNPFATGTATSAGALTVTAGAASWTPDQWIGYTVRRTGGPSVKTITSMTRSGSTVTVNTSAAHGFANGDQVFVFGANQTAYNTHWSVTVSDSDTFTFATNYTPVTPATGTMLCSKQGFFSEIVDNTATMLTFRDSAFAGVYTLAFQTGDTFEINKVTQTMDMVGRSGGSLVSGTTPTLPVGWNDQVTSPWYEWNNTREGGADVDFSNVISGFPYMVLVENTHFINDTAKPGYTTYAYPHPLTGDDPEPPAGGGSVAFGAGAGSASFGAGAGNVTFQ